MTELQNLIAELAYRAGVHDSVLEGSNHPYTCRCATCLQWWVNCGPEDAGDHWSFGPFTQAEYEAAGGKVPDYSHGEYEHDDNDGDGWDDGERWDFSESVSWF